MSLASESRWLLRRASRIGVSGGLSSRMKSIVNFLQSRLIDVRIDLRRRDTRVAQHLLDLAQVGSTGQQMRREAVSHCMRAD